jgi:hypothetical protein
MKNGFIALAIASSLTLSLSAFADKPASKGATYQAPVVEKASKGAVYHAPVKETSPGAWYIGAGVNGSSQFSMNQPLVTLSTQTESTMLIPSSFPEGEQDSANLGFDVYVGYDFNKYWAAEVGYTYVGEITYVDESNEITRGKETVNQWNAHVVGMGKLPVGDYVNFFLKAGIAYYANKTETYDLSNGPETYLFDATSDSMTLTYGAGAELHWENWGIRGEYNVIYPANNIRQDFLIADIISANIYYKFL